MEHPETKDDDNLLILKVWAEQNPNLRNPGYKFINFATAFLDNRYVDAETIRRTRQKLQQHEPETRGVKWQARHDEGDTTRKEIHDA